MTESVDPWAYYARLQQRSAKLTRLDPYWWGLESALAYLLHAIADGVVPKEKAALEGTLRRTIASGARLFRSRAAALMDFGQETDGEPAPASGFEARSELRRIVRLVSSADQDVLIETGLGFSDREIAQHQDTTSGAVRVRLSRLRLKLAA